MNLNVSLFEMVANEKMIAFVEILDKFNTPIFFLIWAVIAILYGKGKIRFSGDKLFYTLLGTYVIMMIYEVSR
ncbi:MAG: hypothetical protein ACRC92_02370 [Peptostreptococcaceae bacterium]